MANIWYAMLAELKRCYHIYYTKLIAKTLLYLQTNVVQCLPFDMQAHQS